jgi:hypothetical protein
MAHHRDSPSDRFPINLTPTTYTLTQLRYDLRKMEARGLLQRDARRYAYRLTDKGTRVALLFVLFHQRVRGPLANSLFRRPSLQTPTAVSKIEAAYHKADRSIEKVNPTLGCLNAYKSQSKILTLGLQFKHLTKDI